MENLLLSVFEGYSIAKVLLTLSVIILLGSFISWIILSVTTFFIHYNRTKVIKWFDKQRSRLGICMAMALGYIFVAIILHYLFKMPI